MEQRLGDRESFTAWATVRRPRLLRTATFLTGDAGRAEDLVQEALAKVAQRWPRLRDANPDAYARQILVRDNISWWRRNRFGWSPRCPIRVVRRRVTPASNAASSSSMPCADSPSDSGPSSSCATSTTSPRPTSRTPSVSPPAPSRAPPTWPCAGCAGLAPELSELLSLEIS